jgi:AcrR family transcriptional regulator
MRRLGRALDADATAIYYYLPNKDALYDAITDAAIGELGDIEESPTDGPFEEFLVAVGRSYHTTLMRHPRALRLLTSSPFHTGTTMTSAELVLGRMLELGLTPDQALAAFGTFGRYVLGAVNTYAQHLLGDEYHIDRPADEVLAELPAERFPNARLVMGQGRFMGFEGEFEFGLRVFARGLEITARQ